MAKRPSRKTKSSAAPRGNTDRNKAADALMTLLAKRSFDEIGLAEIAGEARLSLSQLRAEFGSVLAILASHIKEIDQQVLDSVDLSMVDEPVRERLFDVLMKRLEILAPYREAIRSLLRSASRRPALAIALNGMALRSQRWMLTAAGIDTQGPRGALRVQGAALTFGHVLSVWVNDHEPNLDRTMAALDRALASAERWSGFLNDLFCIPAALRRGFRPRRSRDKDEPAAA